LIMDENPPVFEGGLPETIPGLESLYDGVEFDAEAEPFLFPISKMLSEVPAHYAEEIFVKAGGEKRIFKVRDLRTDRVVALARPEEDADTELV